MLPLEFVLELFIYLTILVGVYWYSGIHQYMKNLNRSLFFFLILFFYLLVAAQVNKTPIQTYPFVNWSMYSQKMPTPSYKEHIITLQDGSSKHYPYEYVTFTSPRAFMQKVENVESSTRDSSSLILEKVIDGLIEIYEKRNPAHEVASFTLTENVITVSKEGFGFEKSKIERFVYEPK